MERTVHIACLQTRPVPTVELAVEEALTYAAEAVERGASFLLLPEYCGGLRSQEGSFLPPVFDADNHPFIKEMQQFANANHVWMLIGSVAVRQGQKFANRSIMMGPDGAILAHYDKIHLFDVALSDQEQYEESRFVTAGSSAVVSTPAFGVVGHSICYDLRFPALYQTLARAGAEMLTVPAAFTKTTGQVHWHVLNRARAIENGAFVLAPCAIGPVPGGGECYGHSLIINPWGEVIADGGGTAGVVDARINLAEVADARRRIPNLSVQPAFSMTHQRNRGAA